MTMNRTLNNRIELPVKVIFVPVGVDFLHYANQIGKDAFYSIDALLDAGMNKEDLFRLAHVNWCVHQETLLADNYMPCKENCQFTFLDLKQNPALLELQTSRQLLGNSFLNVGDKYGSRVKQDHHIREDFYQHLVVTSNNGVLVLLETEEIQHECPHTYLETCLDTAAKLVPTSSLLASSLFKVFSRTHNHSPKQAEEAGLVLVNDRVDFR